MPYRRLVLKFIVGLGNPGSRYEFTRHNVGFLALDQFDDKEGPSEEGSGRRCEYRNKHEALYKVRHLCGQDVMLLKPQTFMNSSGRAVRAALRDFAPELLEPPEDPAEKLDLREHLLVVSDEFALPEGKLRFRGRGSAGGHNGLASVISALRTELFGRLRVGVGDPAGSAPAHGTRDTDGTRETDGAADYVLEPLTAEHRDRLNKTAAHAASTLRTWTEHGIVTCANRFNGAEGELPLET